MNAKEIILCLVPLVILYILLKIWVYHGNLLLIESFNMNGWLFNKYIFIYRGNDGYMEGATIVPKTRIIITTKNNSTMETII